MQVLRLRENYFTSRTFVAVESNEAIIVDAGVELDTVRQALNEANNPKVLAILLTHAHYDHILHLQDYINYFDCDVYVSSKGVDNLQDTVANYSKFVQLDIVIAGDRIKSLPQNNKLSIGHFTVDILHTPGHTDDSVCYIMANSMFTGDTIFSNTIGRTDLINSSYEQMKQSIKLLNNYTYLDNYYPGHGKVFTAKELQDLMTYLKQVM